jgi:hypothetical protein
MPRISDFLGIAIYMYFSEHGAPHFHAIYGQYEAVIGIDPITILDGRLPNRVRSLVFEWAAIYQNELRENWRLAREGEPLQGIPSLE